jgi:hypothetical protein
VPLRSAQPPAPLRPANADEKHRCRRPGWSSSQAVGSNQRAPQRAKAPRRADALPWRTSQRCNQLPPPAAAAASTRRRKLTPARRQGRRLCAATTSPPRATAATRDVVSARPLGMCLGVPPRPPLPRATVRRLHVPAVVALVGLGGGPGWQDPIAFHYFV